MKFPLLAQVIVAVLLGVLLGYWLPIPVMRGFVTFNTIFSQYLGFCIPLIILGLIISGISQLGTHSGRLLILTVALAYGSTLFSGFFTYFCCAATFPPLLEGISVPAMEGTSGLTETLDGVDITPFFNVEIKPVMDVMAALVAAFIFGIGIPVCRATTLQKAASEFKVIIEQLIGKTIIPLLPLFIFGIFLEMTAEGSAMKMLDVFGRVIGVVFALHFLLLFLQYLLAGIVTRRNPFRLFWTMLPAYMTALGTSSSAATIPVTLVQVKKNGVRDAIAEFCVPLCATIHLAGSTMKITAFSIAMVLIMHQIPTLEMYAAFICLLGITMVAAPGVPGGAIMAATALLSSVLGFNEMAIGLMISLYITTDCFGTACNVCGDGAISLLVDRCVQTDNPEQ